MKKIISILAVVSALTACGSMSEQINANKEGTAKARLTACMTNEATAKFKAGTLAKTDVKTTAKEISTTCVKKLALQSAGLDTTETTTMATSVIENLLKK